MMASVEFWFEFASTYSYPAAFAVEERARARGVRIAWRSFLLAPIFGAQGWNDSPFNIYPAKGAYMWRDLARICARQASRCAARRNSRATACLPPALLADLQKSNGCPNSCAAPTP